MLRSFFSQCIICSHFASWPMSQKVKINSLNIKCHKCMAKVVFITFHNWETKRLGGFHKFAEYCCEKGMETVFFSFSRPYYIYFKKSERLNKGVLKKLVGGKKYKLGGNTLLNITFPTLALPGPLRTFVPDRLNTWLITNSVKSFSKFARNYFKGTDVFVFESNESVFLINKIKKLFPNSKIIYRPSDPIIANSNISEAKCIFEKEILNLADIVLPVNEQGLQLYEKVVSGFKNNVTYKVLSNGVDTCLFEKQYKKPVALQKANTALYMGALAPNWQLIIKAAKALTNVNFVIVCPEMPDDKYKKEFENIRNLCFVPGVLSEDVPKWVTNADLIIVPNPEDRYQDKPWGITAKYYQAMAARKPIVAYHDTIELEKLSVSVSYSENDFIVAIQDSIGCEEQRYEYDLRKKNWAVVCQEFVEIVNELCYV
ncbi:glycosyltransferase [Puteibacter caeruleilacunae]|nr:glycosyltransferase [Puteibacter caeruleilacunae]